MKSNNILVSVLMITYNHEKYITQAIDSVLKQKTNFEFEIVIGEDCSTDRTREIILEYKSRHSDKIKLLLQETNKGAIQNFIDTFRLCNGEYIAFLEGDDYWIDPYKLQKQVDFLEANPDYGLVHTNVIVVDNENKVIYFSDETKPDGDVFYYLLTKRAFIVTCSVCARGDLVREIANRAITEKLTFVFDYWLWLHIAMRSKVHYLKEATSAYRSHPGGISKKGNTYFRTVIPAAVLDVIKTKLELNNNLKFKEKWILLEKFNRTLLMRGIDKKTRLKFIKISLKYPFYFFTFFSAIIKKIIFRLTKYHI